MKLDKWQDLGYHSFCTLFPQMTENEYTALVADIKLNGLAESITVLETDPGEYEILDGRNRHLACLDSGTIPTFTQYEGKDPLKFAISKNIGRRHLGTGQLAALASEVADAAVGQNQFTQEQVYTREQAAIIFGTSVKSIQRYREIFGICPKTAADVAAGNIRSLTQGLQIAKDSIPSTPDFEGQKPTEPKEGEFNENSNFGTNPEFPPLNDKPDAPEVTKFDAEANRERMDEVIKRSEEREPAVTMTMTKEQYADLGKGFAIRMKSGSMTIDISIAK